ncbi:HET-domain-containing protein [Coniochaeta ligniaria NRRL 30616]|uniref:HET-domain-containing protein n=1 Tax=Coniochaeta ligniaria NRRL 30616 TaxID=1408157 RepID=A0A1J7JD72_9PEZI|nr:HET-domain-containing protein [Coniochaeta ligniaria NRRL 30616]
MLYWILLCQTYKAIQRQALPLEIPMMSFKYGGRLRDREIRLVNVIEADQTPLHVQLAVHQLDDVEFEALSYVWGDPSNKLEIMCNGQPFGVTENVHSALLERRRRDLKLLLWVDALCINQSDTDERTHQVRMMRAIYNSAKTVIVWLGQDGPNDSEGTELVERVYRECGGLSFDIESVREGVRVDDFDYIERGFPTPFRHPSTAENPGWKSAFELLKNSWFTRVWVVQELLVAKQSVIWRGRLDLDPNAILFAAMLVDTKRDLWLDFNRYAASSCHAINIARLYFRYRKKGQQPFWDTLCLCRNLQASDLRDKYFALVGISSGLVYELVDYNKTLREVHAQVGCLCLRGLPERGLPCSGLDLLAYGHYRDHTSSTFGAVSWVPGLISADRFAITIAEAYPTAELCKTKRGYAAARYMEDYGFLFDMEQTLAVEQKLAALTSLCRVRRD